MKVFPVPTHWSTEISNKNKYTTVKPFSSKITQPPVNPPKVQSVKNTKKIVAASSEQFPNINKVNGLVDPPSKFFQPPKEEVEIQKAEQTTHGNRKPSSTTARSIASFNNELLSGSTKTDNFQASAEDDQPFKIDVRVDASSSVEDSGKDASIVKFINSLTANSTSNLEIQSSSETAGFATQNFLRPPLNKGFNNNDKFNSIDENSLNTEGFRPIIVASTGPAEEPIEPPPNDLLPPKKEYHSDIASTTMGPPIYYEWKWAVPAFDLEPPNVGSVEGKPFNSSDDKRPQFALPRSTTQRSIDIDSVASNLTNTNNLNLTSYFIPDYVFPLDKQHPGYEEDGAITSFQVRIPHSAGDKGGDDKSHPYYGENPECPHCHPSFVVPGTCKPCVMIRR